MIRRLRELPPQQQVVAAVLAAALVGALGVAVPRLGNAAMLLASAGLLAMLAVLAQWLWQHQHTTDWSNSFVDPAPARGGDVRIARLSEGILAAGAGDPKAEHQLHELLTGLAADRLRAGRGLDTTADADAVRAALGPDLAAYLAAPPTGAHRRIGTDRLAQFVTTLEDL